MKSLEQRVLERKARFDAENVAPEAPRRRAKLRKRAIQDQTDPETTGQDTASLIFGFGAPEEVGVGGLAAKGLARRAAGKGAARAIGGVLGPAAPALLAPPASVAAKRKNVGKYVKGKKNG